VYAVMAEGAIVGPSPAEPELQQRPHHFTRRRLHLHRSRISQNRVHWRLRRPLGEARARMAFILAFSRGLARFIAKHAKPEV